MSILENKIVFITGATSGIGKACAYSFAKEKANLIINARREDLLNEIAGDLRDNYGIKVLAFKMDVTKREEVEKAIADIPEEWKNIDILLNNAGLAKGLAKLHEDDPENWEVMIDTNVKGLLYVTRAIVPGMVQRNLGHIINLGSIAGRIAYPKGGVYCATKHALNAITNSLRIDVNDKNIRVSTVDPGAVETNFSLIRFNGDKQKSDEVYRGYEQLVADDIAECVLFCATRPPHVSIHEIVVMPRAQANPFVLHREE
jgi:3-hydroxy acid dehydrogenase/malonic semialdehyde reductase